MKVFLITDYFSGDTDYYLVFADSKEEAKTIYLNAEYPSGNEKWIGDIKITEIENNKIPFHIHSHES